MKPTLVYRRLLPVLRPYVWPRFVVAVACMLLYSSTTAVMPFLVERIYDDIFGGHDFFMLTWLPVLIIGVFVVRGLASYGGAYLTDYVGQRIVTDLRDQLNSRIQYLPLSFFNRTPTGTILSRISSDVTQIRFVLTEATASLIRDSTSLVCLVVVAFLKDWMLAVIAFVAFPVSVLPLIRLSQRLRRFSRRGQEQLGMLTALLQETIQGNRIVKAFSMEEYEKARFAAENHRLFRLYMKASRIKAFVPPSMEILAAFGIAGVVWYGGYSVLVGGRTPGSFLAFLTALFLVYDPFKGLARTGTQLQLGLAAAERIFEIVDLESDVGERPDAVVLPRFRGAIEFDGVGFRYAPRAREGVGRDGSGRDDSDREGLGNGRAAVGNGGEANLSGERGDGEPQGEEGSNGRESARESELTLRDVGLTLNKGEAVALVGMSGSGKSTLADLIPRFYDPTFGRILIDGHDLRDVTVASLRAQIGIVTQFTFLFNDTVRANIAYGSSEPAMEAIEAAARAAHAHEFIVALPDGYDTVVGELGVTLSGGQRQRIAIARALLKNAPILILDEATSALDSESERLVQGAIDHLMAGRTTLVIAHRLATIQRANRIVVLSEGRIVEEGTHEGLLKRGEIYRKLCEQQMLRGEGGGQSPLPAATNDPKARCA